MRTLKYPDHIHWYDSERRDRMGYIEGAVQSQSPGVLGYDFTNASMYLYNVNLSDLPTTIKVLEYSNKVKVYIDINSIGTGSPTRTMNYRVYYKDSQNNEISSLSMTYPAEYPLISDGIIDNALQFYYCPASLNYGNNTGDGTPESFDVDHFWFRGHSDTSLYPQLNQWYSRDFIGYGDTAYYRHLSRMTYYTQKDFEDNYWNTLINGGDGTPITPILPSEDTSTTGGGDDANPDYNPFSDPIDFPGLPTGGGSIATGFIRVYSPSTSQLQSLAGVLWGNDFVDTIKKIQNDPMEAIISLHSIPFSLVGSNAECRIGNFNTGINMPAVNTQFHTLNLGSIYIPEHWASALDYSPYVSVDLYVPFCGVVSVQVDDIVGRTISVKMNIDIVGGEALISVMCDNSVLYTYNTNVILRHPISQSSFGPLYQSVLGMLGSTASGFASGGVGGAVGGAIGGALNVAVSKQHAVSRGGSIGGATGVLGNFTPYLIIHRPIQSLASGFAHFKGYPSNITTNLSSVSGYTEVESVHLSGITCTDSEKAEIEALLYNGVIL